MLFPVVGHAQVAAGAAVQAATSANAIIVNGGSGGGGTGGGSSAVVNGFQNPQIIAGQSTIGPTVMTPNKCKDPLSGSLPFGFGLGGVTTDKACVAKEEATWLFQAGQAAAAMERICDVPEIRDALARSPGAYQCTATVEARRVADEKAARNRPVAQAPQPVVMASTAPTWTQTCPLKTLPDGRQTYACQ